MMTKTSVAESAHQKIAGVIEIRHAKPMVSSLKIAEMFERRHDNVLAAIRKELAREISLLELKESETTTRRGKTIPVFWLNEEQALFVMPFIGGKLAREGQRKLVKAYLFYRDAYANPPRRDILTDKRRSGSLMCEIVKEVREDAGKETAPHNYGTEYKLCNWALTGEFKKLDEATLDNASIELLQKIRAYNTSLIQAEITYAERKPRLAQYAIRQRTKLLSAPGAATE